MNFKAFNNYVEAIKNANDAEFNNHPQNTEKVFGEHGAWALHLLERVYADKDKNLRRWLKGLPCRFTSDKSGRKIEIQIGNDREAIYYFLMFCKKINTHQVISEDFREYLAYLISRSNFKGVWE